MKAERFIRIFDALLMGICFAAPAWAAPPAEEQATDQKIGLLDRPWKITKIRLAVRQKHTLLPPYDQQVEKAQVVVAKGLLGTATAGSAGGGVKKGGGGGVPTGGGGPPHAGPPPP